jgi:uncharacterized protein (TIGR03000 family)
MVLVMALGNSAVTPSYHAEEAFNQARYGNHLQTEHYRGRRRGGCCGCCGGGGGCYGGGCYGGGCYGGCWGGGCYGGCWGGGCTGGYMMGGTRARYGSAYMGEMPYGPSGAMPMPADRSRSDYGVGGQYERRYEEPAGEPADRGERRNERGNDRRDEGNRESRVTAPATIVVTLPADAKLTVDGQTTRSTSGERSFVTPPLATDQNFSYTLKAEIMGDGQPVTIRRQVTVRGGEETRVDLAFPEATAGRR